MKIGQTVKITKNKGCGTVSPVETHLAQGQEVTFTITAGTAVVFIPDSDYLESDGIVNGKKVHVRIQGGGIFLRVGKGGSKIRRNGVPLEPKKAKRYPLGIYIDGAPGFAKGSTPVMILDPP